MDRIETVAWYLRHLSTHPWIHDQNRRLYSILGDLVEFRLHLPDPEADAVSFFEKSPGLVPVVDRIVDLLEVEARRVYYD